jgi:hypothetical protein
MYLPPVTLRVFRPVNLPVANNRFFRWPITAQDEQAGYGGYYF